MTETLCITIEQEEFDSLKEAEEIIQWLDREASHIKLKNGINWYNVQWDGLDGLKKCLLSTKKRLEKNKDEED